MQEETTETVGLNYKTWLQKYGYLLIFAAVSVLIALFAFGSSPFYPINEWAYSRFGDLLRQPTPSPASLLRG